MTKYKTKATKPGQPSIRVALTPEEESQRLLDRANSLAKIEKRKAVEYRRLRAEAYPSLGDVVDALCDQLSGSSDLKPKLTELLAKRDSVKAKYPKPAPK